MSDTSPSTLSLARSLTTKMNRSRAIKNRITSVSMAIGGISVILSIVLIFFYLAYVVYPLFSSAEMQKIASYPLPASTQGKTLHLAIEEQNQIAVRFTEQAKAIFFNTTNGDVVENLDMPLPAKTTVSSFTTSHIAKGVFAFGLSNGQAIVAQHKYATRYIGNDKNIIPSLVYPIGETPIDMGVEGKHALTHIGLMHDSEKATLVAYTDDNRLLLNQLIFEDELSTDEDAEAVSFESTKIEIPNIQYVYKLLIDASQSLLYVAHTNGDVSLIDISDLDDVQVLERKRVVAEGAEITNFSFLTGEISLLIGDNKGNISQWFPVKKATGLTLSHIRDFNSQQSTIIEVVTEQRRKGFAAIDDKGQLAFYHSTARRTILHQAINETRLNFLAISPRANAFIVEDNKQLHLWHIENEHPEMSWAVLWDEIWYESYPEPSYTWQSSSSSNDFEPKFSLMPLAFGTLKAAFYAMLFAMPLAIMGAIYTAYFMAPKMRTYVKPTIEIMEALPTVILGFLAGLWLAPIIESHLPGVFSMLIILPTGVLIFAFAWKFLPKEIRQRIPDGWQAALLIPVLLFTGWLAMILSLPMENLFFNGDMKTWLSESIGLDYDQRNSLVVGIAMGVAVIPTIFSITEDAIFSVPKNLTFGSLALGATPWQTLIYVVILTASPGIFSAVMIGMGRAVGETMIVLMATGNTPVMDLSIFQGMRTLAANVAVEMPESEVDSTHYRILFLAALVLFVFTFIFNTLAEIVRQRLRKKYSSL